MSAPALFDPVRSALRVAACANAPWAPPAKPQMPAAEAAIACRRSKVIRAIGETSMLLGDLADDPPHRVLIGTAGKRSTAGLISAKPEDFARHGPVSPALRRLCRRSEPATRVKLAGTRGVP